ncbi:phage terminase large subunit [Inquilinus limosus]|uniref:phage terminase large subunit n=1 Tax=Inquilinus limosus TaxID=171674 RepID=UPI0003FF8D7B|nr:phage terminase large subunit [Inquilinus limosus]
MTKPNPLHDPLARDFRVFLTLVWRHLGLPDPTPVQLDIAHYMQHGPKRAIIEAFRGVGKSWMFSAFICWRLYVDPDWKIEIVSASKTLADSISTFVKRLIREMPELQHLQPGKDQRDSNLQFDVGPARASKDPSVKSVGITGQITGSRADEILADDVEVPNNSGTQMQREKLRELVKEFGAIAKPETGYIRFLGTPQVEDSLYSWLVDQTAGDELGGFRMRIWPAEVPADPSKYGDKLAPFVQTLVERGVPPGTPVCTRFSREKLASEAHLYGRTGYALQFMLDTSLSDMDKFPLRLGDLVVADIDPDMAPVKYVWAAGPDQHLKDLSEYAYGLRGDRLYRPMDVVREYLPYTHTVMQLDPSGRGQDETGYAIVKHSNGRLFLVASGGFKDGYGTATLQKIVALAKLHKVNTVRIESNFGDGMFSRLLQPVFVQNEYPVEIIDERASNQKEVRIIDTLEPLLAQHKLIVDPKVIEMDARSAMAYGGDRWRDYCLTYQLTHITKERGALAHDDRLDALAGACAYFLEVMAKDSEKGAEEAKEAALDAMFAQFVEEFGGPQPRPAWLNGMV